MTWRSSSVSKAETWIYTGTRFDGDHSTIRIEPQLHQNIFLHATESTESFNSPQLWRKVQRIEKWVPRKDSHVNEPHYPWPQVTRRPVIYPQRPNQSNRSYAGVLRRYADLMRRYELLVSLRMSHWEHRMRKYRLGMEKFLAYKQRLRYGVTKMKRVRVLAHRELPFQPYSRITKTFSGWQGYLKTNGRQWVYFQPVEYWHMASGFVEFEGVANSGWSTPSSNEARSNAAEAANSIALSRYREKLADRHVHVAQVIAERIQTLDLIADAVRRIAYLIGKYNVKHLGSSLVKLVSTKKGTKQVANDTLAYMFGVRPLIDDVYGAAEALAHLATDNLRYPFVHLKATANKVENSSETTTSGGWTHTLTTRVAVRTSYVIEYDLENVLTREMSKLGLINPAEIIWELTPWSFVVDWFIPIGNYIRDLFSDSGLTFKRGVKSTRTVITQTRTSVRQDVDPLSVPRYWGSEEWSSGQVTANYVEVRKERQVLFAPPNVALPALKSPISAFHLIEALALLRQKIR